MSGRYAARRDRGTSGRYGAAHSYGTTVRTQRTLTAA
jgi:hypothetical protein